MSSSDRYKREIMKDLAQGNVESLDSQSTDVNEEYASFDDFAKRSSCDERRSIFGRAFHPERVPAQQMEPELRQAISKIKPNERDDVARDFFKHLKERGLDERTLESQLGLSTHNARRMKEDDVAKLASFAYHSHPDIFKVVLAYHPAIVKFLSNPHVGAALRAVPTYWFGRH